MPCGRLSDALVAGPSSPVGAGEALPATVVMLPACAADGAVIARQQAAATARRKEPRSEPRVFRAMSRPLTRLVPTMRQSGRRAIRYTLSAAGRNWRERQMLASIANASFQ